MIKIQNTKIQTNKIRKILKHRKIQKKARIKNS
jgi:hypothetical protein